MWKKRREKKIQKSLGQLMEIYAKFLKMLFQRMRSRTEERTVQKITGHD